MALPGNIRIEKKISTSLSSFIRKGKYSSYFIICDSNTLQFCLARLISAAPILQDAEIIELEPGEESKSLEIAANVWETMTQFGADKKCLVINLGGGMISDIGGFCASVYKRGVHSINIPTTLLAMADASVGGKNGINMNGVKNHIGTITQPEFVFINTGFLQTLPLEHTRNGYAEIVKMALIADKKFFQVIENVSADDSKDLTSIVKKSVELKYAIIKKDPHEKSLRKILNFGHTFGHAIESLYFTKSDSLLHGEAVAVGMAMEACLCLKMKRITQKDFERIIKCLTQNFALLRLNKEDFPAFFRYFEQDKKHSSGRFNFALLNAIGKCDPEVKVTRVQIDDAIAYYNSIIAE